MIGDRDDNDTLPAQRTDSLAIQLIHTKWTKQHKLAMCVLYDHAQPGTQAFESAIYNQLMYLDAKAEESRIWNRMTTDDYIEYLRILERFQGES
jgi:hypothetical protein